MNCGFILAHPPVYISSQKFAFTVVKKCILHSYKNVNHVVFSAGALDVNSLVTGCFYAIISITPSTPEKKKKSEYCCGICTLGPIQKSNGQSSDQSHLMLMLTLLLAGGWTT